MTLWEEIRELRWVGKVRCGEIEGVFEDSQKAASGFGLELSGTGVRLDPNLARRILRDVLEFDLAYRVRLMPEQVAARLADRFATIARLDDSSTRLYTNVDRPFAGSGGLLGSWMPATGATFDTGVLAIAKDRCACLWVEDED